MCGGESIDRYRFTGATGCGRWLRGCRGQRAHRIIGLIVLWLSIAPSAGADVLAECRALSTEDDDIHICLDNFLDDLDDSMELLAEQVNGELEVMAATLFQRSQKAFVNYRRRNCLWYVSFSGPRRVAEQLGKNCLVDMTRDRLAELRALLVVSEQAKGRLQGYYVYGADHNTFIACGSGSRYWVESDNGAAGELQQTYLELATAERQLLYADLQGELVEEAQTYQGHAGHADITGVTTLRVPLESDCPVPSTSDVSTTVLAAQALANGDTQQAAADSGTAQSEADEDGPEQQLNAYFGAWQAACLQSGSDYSCDLSVAMERAAASAEDPQPPVQLQLKRLPNAQTTVELRFDDVEIDSPSRIRWGIDDNDLGVIAFSVVRVDENATRQVIVDPDFLARELLPDLKGGTQVGIEVVESEDDASGERFVGTLMGLTRALKFADDFIEGAGS